MKAVLGLGSNIGFRGENIKTAIKSLALVPGVKILRESSVYKTSPWGLTQQRDFYNNVVEVETELSPNALLGACLGIEAAMGRVRVLENGPRIIDIDVLVYENAVSDTKELQLPHPRIGERMFVLVPLIDLYEDLNVLGVSYKNAYENLLKIDIADKVEKS